jgi:hypothetical protein
MTDLTDGHKIETDHSKPGDTAKLAMFKLSDGGVRFIIMEHPSNKQLAYVDVTAADVRRLIEHDLPRLLEE